MDKIKQIIGIENFYDTKILIGANDKLPDDITLKNVVILMTCVMKHIIKFYGKFYLQLFLEEALLEA